MVSLRVAQGCLFVEGCFAPCVSAKEGAGLWGCVEGKSKYVYATIYKSKGGKSVRLQIDAAFGAMRA